VVRRFKELCMSEYKSASRLSGTERPGRSNGSVVRAGERACVVLRAEKVAVSDVSHETSKLVF
jgi:hypothetical protein